MKKLLLPVLSLGRRVTPVSASTGPGRGLLALGVSANSEKANGVLVTGVLDTSL